MSQQQSNTTKINLIMVPKVSFVRSNFEFVSSISKINHDVYWPCGEKLTAGTEEKKRVTKQNKNNHFKLVSEIKQHINSLDFAHISSVFFISDGKKIQKW